MKAISEARKAERIAELEGERRWHLAEIQDARQTIVHHESNVRDIDEQLRALKANDADGQPALPTREA